MIDGDHSRAGVLSDWRNLAPLLCPGGVVIFDDYSPEHPGVIEAVDEIRAGLQGWCYLGCLGTSAVFRRNPCPGYEWSGSA